MLFEFVPSESQYLAQYVCDELDNVDVDNRDKVIKLAAIDIIEDWMKDNKKLARDVRVELLGCYSKFITDKDLPKIQ